MWVRRLVLLKNKGLRSGYPFVVLLISKKVPLYAMSKLIFHNNANNDSLTRQRSLHFNSLPLSQKLNELFALIDLAVKTSGGQPLKKPVGAGLVLRKQNPHGHL